MILMLTWLTVSLPFVNAAGKETTQTAPEKKSPSDTNPLTGTTEEKCNSSVSMAEEYLHDGHHELDNYITRVKLNFYHTDETTYVAFHGELLSPPPDFSC